eukprot:51303-Pleurochrysis_carterae.AAC.3
MNLSCERARCHLKLLKLRLTKREKVIAPGDASNQAGPAPRRARRHSDIAHRALARQCHSPGGAGSSDQDASLDCPCASRVNAPALFVGFLRMCDKFADNRTMGNCNLNFGILCTQALEISAMAENALRGLLEKAGVGLTMANKWTDPTMQLIGSIALGVPLVVILHILIAVYVGILYVPALPAAMYAYYQLAWLATPAASTEEFLEFKVLSCGSFDVSTVAVFGRSLEKAGCIPWCANVLLRSEFLLWLRVST